MHTIDISFVFPRDKNEVFFFERKFNIFSRILEDGDGRSVIYNVSSARGQFFSF